MAKKEIKSVAEESPGHPAFESAMARLEAIADEMESGELPLEDLLSRYEEGLKLSQICAAKLDAAEARIRQVTEDASGGLAVTGFGEDTSSQSKADGAASVAGQSRRQADQGDTDDEVSLF